MKTKFRALGLALATGVILFAPLSYAQSSSADLKARVEERRTRLNKKLSAAEKSRIQGRCVAAQAKLDATIRKVSDNHQPFLNAYGAYVKRLDKIIEKQTADGKDVTELKKQVATLNQKYEAYKTNLTQLSTTLSDLKTVDCKAEPNGFMATLQDARTQVLSLQTARKELNAFNKDTVIKLLQTMKQEKP